MSIQYEFASAVYHARKAMQLTQAEAAEALDISLRWYQEIEIGRVLPGNDLLLEIFVFFEIDGAKIKEKLYAKV